MNFETLQQSLSSGTEISISVILFRLVLALVAGLIIAWLYGKTRDGSGAVSLPATLVLLAVLIASVTQVIGDNVARAFSLVGALSIVRFRTVVRDTRDTAFVIFVVVVGMAIGSGHAIVASVALVVTGFAAWLMRPGGLGGEEHPELILTLKMNLAQDIGALTKNVFQRHVATREDAGASTAKQGAAIEVSWRITLVPGSTSPDLVRDFNRLEGILGVELHPAEGAR